MKNGATKLNINQTNKAQKKLDEIMSTLRKHRDTIEKTHKVKEMGIFGSYARGDQKKIVTLTSLSNSMTSPVCSNLLIFNVSCSRYC